MMIKMKIIIVFFRGKNKLTSENDNFHLHLKSYLQGFLAHTPMNAGLQPGQQLQAQMCKQTAQINKIPMATKSACTENCWSCSYLWFYTDSRNVNQASKQQENGKGKEEFAWRL